MFINRLFREQALAKRQRQEPLDDRLQVTAPHEWLLVAGLGVMFLALERAFIKSQNAFVTKLHAGELESSDVYRVAPTGMGLRLVGRCLGSVSIWLFYLPVSMLTIVAWQFIFQCGALSEVVP